MMNMQITIDKAGRIVLPKPLRQSLCLEAGDTLELTSQGENISLRPVRGVSPLQKEKGVWVYHTGRPLSQEAVRAVRDEVHQDRLQRARGSTQ
ncbi:MAG: AbrB/MazE/SpoVT family DNA-binding domain-containing protein [Phycisphaerae bacterium]|nr:AbrB/MazE/SpoVT family DNA-binding domain-containing protein [Phycisphaerae bacterium]